MIYDYEIWIDVDRDQTFGNGLGDVTNYVKSLRWSAGVAKPYDDIGLPADAEIKLDNSDRRFSLNDASSPFYGLLQNNTLVRLRCTYQGTTETMFILRIEDVLPDPVGFNAEPEVLLRCTDVTQELFHSTFLPTLQQNVRVDEVIQYIFDQALVIWPFDSAFFYINFDSINGSQLIFSNNITSFDQGNSSFTYVGDNFDRASGVQAQGFIRDVMRAEMSGLLFFQPRTQQMVFFNRIHQKVLSESPLTLNTSQYTFTMKDIERVDQRWGAELVNDLTLSYEPRAVGSAGTLIYDSDNVPITLDTDRPRNISMRYRDPDNEDQAIGAIDVIAIKPGVDLLVNTAADGSGTDVSNQLTYSEEIGAEKTELIVTWQGGGTVYITTLQQRGTPLIRYNAQTLNKTNANSIYTYGRKMRRDTVRSISDADLAQIYVDYMINAFSIPVQKIEKVTFVVKEASTALYYLQLTMGDVITIEDEVLVQMDYMIVGEQHDVDLIHGEHRVSWVLRTIEHTSPFVINTSFINGPDIIVA